MTEAASSGCGPERHGPHHLRRGAGDDVAEAVVKLAANGKWYVGRQLKGLLHVLMLPDFERADRIGEIIR